jgi:hypothetical protein
MIESYDVEGGALRAMGPARKGHAGSRHLAFTSLEDSSGNVFSHEARAGAPAFD